MRKNDAFVAKIVITRLTKGFMAMFAPAESLPSPATLPGTESNWLHYTFKGFLQQHFSISATSFCIFATRSIYTDA